MPHRFLDRAVGFLCTVICGAIRADLNRQEFAWLVRPRSHLALLASRRSHIVVTRARLFAAVFGILTPLWGVLDVLAFPAEIWRVLLVARVAATIAFAYIVVRFRKAEGPRDAHRALAVLLSVPAVFFFVTHGYMANYELHGIQEAFGQGYAFLPFVLVAGLSIFPLTLLECLAFAAPMVLVQLFAAAVLWSDIAWPQAAAIIWLLLLIAAVSALAGLSQLAFMIVLVRDAIRDRMTGCFSRNSGEELLQLQFTLSRRTAAPMSVAFLDVDRFKGINDRFGHEAGDKVLAEAAARIRSHLRLGDILIRWGGEEFVIVMPDVGAQQASSALARLRAGGLGRAPDGAAVTASIGIAERAADAAPDWRQLVELADQRMYQAKQAGRDRIVMASGGAGGAKAACEQSPEIVDSAVN